MEIQQSYLKKKKKKNNFDSILYISYSNNYLNE